LIGKGADRHGSLTQVDILKISRFVCIVKPRTGHHNMSLWISPVAFF
jgi:hypothetical protein